VVERRNRVSLAARNERNNMADSVTSFTTNPDGSAVLEVNFDITGTGLSSWLASNCADFSLAPNLDANNNVIAWTQDTALAALSSAIATSKAAFFAAAPNAAQPTDGD
jgi:hypothetical protein